MDDCNTEAVILCSLESTLLMVCMQVERGMLMNYKAQPDYLHIIKLISELRNKMDSTKLFCLSFCDACDLFAKIFTESDKTPLIYNICKEYINLFKWCLCKIMGVDISN